MERKCIFAVSHSYKLVMQLLSYLRTMEEFVCILNTMIIVKGCRSLSLSLSLSPEEKSGTFVTFVSLDDSYA